MSCIPHRFLRMLHVGPRSVGMVMSTPVSAVVSQLFLCHSLCCAGLKLDPHAYVCYAGQLCVAYFRDRKRCVVLRKGSRVNLPGPKCTHVWINTVSGRGRSPQGGCQVEVLASDNWHGRGKLACGDRVDRVREKFGPSHECVGRLMSAVSVMSLGDDDDPAVF